VLLPIHIAIGFAEAATLGNGFDVTATLSLVVQPFKVVVTV